MEEITTKIQDEARKLLRDGRASAVVGYRRGWNATVAVPSFITDEAEADELIFDAACTHNLTKYLVGREGLLTPAVPDGEERPPVAIVARPETQRTIVALIQEKRFERSEVIVLAISDGSAVGLDADVEVGRIEENGDDRAELLSQIEAIDAMPPAERWTYWQEELSKCIRCYACRQVCPFCYCERCITDENSPQWIARGSSALANVSWNVIRAYHLVGRCTECGECERACPMNIPLRQLNTKMALMVEGAFGYKAGIDTEARPPLHEFKEDDNDDFIL